MKKISLLTMAMVFATTLAYAHCGMCGMDKMKSEDWEKKTIEKMTEKLSLTEEQVPQVEAVVKEKMEKKKAAKEEYKAKVETIKEEYRGKIDGILTDEQKVKHAEWMKEKEEMMKKEGMGKGPKHMHGGKKEMMDDEGMKEDMKEW